MAAATCPRIETDRLVLRAHRRDEFEHYAAMWANADVTRYIGGRPLTREAAWTRFLRYAGHWPLMGFGFWAIEERATGRFIGEAGFHEMRRELVPTIEGIPEVGWTLSPAAQGKGYASEALAAVLAWGERHFGERDFVCLIDLDNERSNRLARKLGFAEETRTTYHGTPLAIHRRRAVA